jgi:hypothetical protein
MSRPRPVRLWFDAVGSAPDGWLLARSAQEARAVLRSRLVSEASLGCAPGPQQASAAELAAWMTDTGIWPTRALRIACADAAAALELCDIINRSGLFTPEPGITLGYVRAEDRTSTYGAAQIVIEFDGCTATCRVGESVPLALADQLPMAIVTAANPAGLTFDDARNKSLNRELQASLSAAGSLVHFPAVGGALGGGHTEQSFAVSDLPVDVVRALARRHGQDAIFVIDSKGVTIRDCSPLRHQDGQRFIDFNSLCRDVEDAAEASRLWHTFRDPAANSLKAILLLERLVGVAAVPWLIALSHTKRTSGALP